MKWNIITHNIRGLNDLENITKERYLINSLASKANIVMIHKHKLRGKSLESIGID